MGIFVINHFIIRVVIFQLTKVLYTHLLKKSILKIKKIKKLLNKLIEIPNMPSNSFYSYFDIFYQTNPLKLFLQSLIIPSSFYTFDIKQPNKWSNN